MTSRLDGILTGRCDGATLLRLGGVPQNHAAVLSDGARKECLMSTNRYGLLIVVALASVFNHTGCKEQPPQPSMQGDLGDGDMTLLPTASVWVNPKIAQGQADWHPFRDPKFDEVADGGGDVPGTAASTTAGSDPAIEKELEELVAEYNGLLADGSLDDVLDFYDEKQVATVEKLIATLPAFTDKLKVLAESAPDQSEKLMTLVARLAPASVLKLEIESITTSGDKQAVGKLSGVPDLSFLPGMPAAADISREVRFQLGDDDYWYVTSPIVALMEKVEPSLARGVGELDALIAAVKSGSALSDAASPEGFLKSMLNSAVGSDSDPVTSGSDKPADGESPD